MTTAISAPPVDPAAFVADLEERRDRRLAAMIRRSPKNNPYASDLDPTSCLRRQVLSITHWAAPAMHGTDRQARFEAGNDAEAKGVAILKEMGLRVSREQMPFEIKGRNGRVIVRGKTDGFVDTEPRGTEIIFEAKSLYPHVYDAINREEDFDRYWWTRRYPWQMQAYLIGYGVPFGFFWLTDLLGNWKAIPIAIDYGKGEQILAFAEEIVDGVERYRAAGENMAVLPPFTKNAAECARCPFFGRTCNPPIEETGATFIEDPDLEASIERWSDLRPAHREYEGLDKRIKDRLKEGAPFKVCGRFAISVTSYPKKEVVQKATIVRRVDIEKIVAGGAAGE